MRAAAAALACALLAGCAATPTAPDAKDLRERRIEKDGHAFTIAGDSVRIDGVGYFPLLRETDDALYVAIAAPDGAAERAPPSAPRPAPAAFSAPHEAVATLRAIDRDGPRAGQWRDAFALADLDADGTQELIATPPRKHLTAPVAFALQRDAAGLQFHRQALALPRRGWDYGAVAVGDFDADGERDLAFAMHLTGVAAAMGRDGGFVEASRGLPGAADGARGSGVSLAVRADGKRELLYVLAEFAAVSGDPSVPRFRGLVGFAHEHGAWHPRDLVDARVTGRDLAFARDERCGELFAAASASGDGARAWRRHGERWTPVALPPSGALRRHAAAVALGDFDADGCSDLAVAGADYFAGGWQATLEIHLARGDGWESRVLERAPGRATLTALASAPAPCCGIVLLAGTQDGGVRAYRLRDAGVERIAEAAPPEHARGCAVRQIEPLGSDLVVAWGGEPTLDRPACRNGGGLGAFAWQ